MSRVISLPNQLIILGIKELSKDKFVPIKNRECFNKPIGGLWCCPYTPDREYISAWQEWCLGNGEEEWLSNDAVIITLKEDAMYWCIDDQEALQDIIDIVGEQEDKMFKLCGMKMNTYIDFEEAKKTFDAIYLTANGQWKTRMPDERNWLNLYGWDCESVLLMNYEKIDKWEYIKLNIKEEI